MSARRPIQPPLLGTVTRLPYNRKAEIADMIATLRAIGFDPHRDQAEALIMEGIRGAGCEPRNETPAARQAAADATARLQLIADWVALDRRTQQTQENQHGQHTKPHALP